MSDTRRTRRYRWTAALAIPAAAAAMAMAVLSQTAMGATGRSHLDMTRIYLLSPAPDVPIAQNNPATGCPFAPVYGYGFEITFQWNLVTSISPRSLLDRVDHYVLFVKQSTVSMPIINWTLTSTSVTAVACASYVPPWYLNGWQWQVTAINSQGKVIASKQGTFSFAPCLPLNGNGCGVSGSSPGAGGGGSSSSG